MRAVLQFREHVPLLWPVLRNCTLLPNSAYATACAFARAYVRGLGVVFRTSCFANVCGSFSRRRKARRETFTVALVRKATRGKLRSFVFDRFMRSPFNARRSSFPRLRVRERTDCPSLSRPRFFFSHSLNRSAFALTRRT